MLQSRRRMSHATKPYHANRPQKVFLVEENNLDEETFSSKTCSSNTVLDNNASSFSRGFIG